MAHRPDIPPGGAGDLHPGAGRGAEGFFRLARQFNGQWTLLNPEGRPFFVKAVHDVRSESADTEVAPAVRLREWGFNAVGLGGDGSGRDDGWPHLATVDFCAGARLISAPGVRLPDVFALDWTTASAARALQVCAPATLARDLIGWVADDGIAWGSPATPHRPGLLQVCLSLEPNFAAYHAAWEFLLALHGGNLTAVARAWAVPLANKEVVREMTRSETGITTRGYSRDEARWLREFAARYFGPTVAALRAADPNHLCLGCHSVSPVPAPVVAAASAAVDVPMLPWSELPPPGELVTPVFATDVEWSSGAFSASPLGGTGNSRLQRLTSIERMLRRARTGLRRLARHPAVVGYAWRQWRDEPGEQPPFGRGLVHVNGAEARENTELIADFNARADALRRTAAKQLSP